MATPQEVWKPIEGYGGVYEISNLGNVRSYRNSRHGTKLLPHFIVGMRGKHYRTVVLCDREKGQKTANVHTLVAKHFVPNPHGLSEVNHIDGDKLNNRADNLEWCTHKSNMEHAKETGLCSCNQKAVRCIETAERYESVTQAAKETGISRTAINNCVKGRSKTAGGYRWEYERSK
jgi:hypothetical protein